ncbi:MAG TPA: MFS transporter [Candidatus Lustribacter sp.]
MTGARAFLAILLSAQFMANMDNIIITVAAPSIALTLQATGAELQLMVAVYVLVSAMLLITSARLGKMFGCRPVYLIGLAVFTTASLFSGLAPNALALIGSRIAQGVGSALMVAQVLTSIQLHFTGPARPRAIAAYTVSLSLSGVAAQFLGGLIVTANLFGSSWRPIFLINLPIGVVLLLLARRIFPRDEIVEKRRADLDVAGVSLFSIAMLLLVLPLTLGRELGWPSWANACIMAGAAISTVFVLWERRVSEAQGAPLLNTRLFASGVVTKGLIALAFSRTAVFSFFFIVALYLQAGLGHSAVYSGSVLLWWGIAYGVAGPVYPRISRAFAHLFGPIGCGLLVLSFAGMSVAAAHGLADGPLFVGLLLLGGFGFGAMSTALMSTITGAAPKEHASDLSGILSTMVPLATVIGISTFGSLFLYLAPNAGLGAAHAFSVVAAALAVSAGCAAIATVAVAGLFGTQPLRRREGLDLR